MPGPIYEQSSAVTDIYEDIQKIIRVGLYRFRRDQLVALPRAAGYPENAREGAVCGAIRTILHEQIDDLPIDEWRDFAERLLGFTDDTANQPASVREQLAGETLIKPLVPSTVRSRGGMREVVSMMMAKEICQWADHHNPTWRFARPAPTIDFT